MVTPNQLYRKFIPWTSENLGCSKPTSFDPAWRCSTRFASKMQGLNVSNISSTSFAGEVTWSLGRGGDLKLNGAWWKDTSTGKPWFSHPKWWKKHYMGFPLDLRENHRFFHMLSHPQNDGFRIYTFHRSWPHLTASLDIPRLTSLFWNGSWPYWFWCVQYLDQMKRLHSTLWLMVFHVAEVYQTI